jgi:glycosyltransferase involved in cell wall biosynthesis
VDLFDDPGPFDLSRLESVRDQEFALLRRFDKIITLTENDKQILSENISQEKIYVSPATVRTDLKEVREFSPFGKKLVFIGSSIHLPNKDGIKWFINSIMPIIEKEIPEIHLDVIGRWDNRFVKEFSRKNVTFQGFVKDLKDAFRSSLMIVPIRIGSGMRLKIIEAVNYGIPFITTTIGVEGLDFEPDKDCLVADGPEEFAKKIIGISKDPSGQQELVRNALRKLTDKYSFESAINRRLDFYKCLN